MFLPLTVATSAALYGVNLEVSILPFSPIYSESESALPCCPGEEAYLPPEPDPDEFSLFPQPATAKSISAAKPNARILFKEYTFINSPYPSLR